MCFIEQVEREQRVDRRGERTEIEQSASSAERTWLDCDLRKLAILRTKGEALRALWPDPVCFQNDLVKVEGVERRPLDILVATVTKTQKKKHQTEACCQR